MGPKSSCDHRVKRARNLRNSSRSRRRRRYQSTHLNKYRESKTAQLVAAVTNSFMRGEFYIYIRASARLFVCVSRAAALISELAIYIQRKQTKVEFVFYKFPSRHQPQVFIPGSNARVFAGGLT